MTDSVLSGLSDAVLLPPFPGPAAPAWLLRALEGGLAGVTLFASNLAGGPSSAAGLTTSLRGAAPDLIVAADEEGGDVTRAWYGAGCPYPGNAALGTVDDTSLTEAVYAAMATDLAALGINLALAPCLDVLSEARNPVIGTRSFGPDPALVARHGAAAVRGLQSRGVAACAKHFPGHGATSADSHLELPEVAGDPADIRERDLPPFQAAADAGAATIMPGHLRVPWLTGELPASLSPSALALLRGELGFSGVVVTDALEMRAVRDVFGLPGSAVRALAAGCDLLCLGRDQSEEDYRAVRSAIVAAVRSGSLPGARLEEAAERAGGLRARLAGTGLAGTGLAGTGLAGTAPGNGGGPAHGTGPGGRAVGREAAQRALRLTGDLPVLRDPVVVEVEPLPSIAAGQPHWGLAGWVPAQNLRRAGAREPGAAAETLRAAAGRSLVLLVRDAHRSNATREFVTSVLAGRPDSVVVEMGLPSWTPPAGTYQAHLATYGASRASAEAAAGLLGLELTNE